MQTQDEKNILATQSSAFLVKAIVQEEITDFNNILQNIKKHGLPCDIIAVIPLQEYLEGIQQKSILHALILWNSDKGAEALKSVLSDPQIMRENIHLPFEVTFKNERKEYLSWIDFAAETQNFDAVNLLVEQGIHLKEGVDVVKAANILIAYIVHITSVIWGLSDDSHRAFFLQKDKNLCMDILIQLFSSPSITKIVVDKPDVSFKQIFISLLSMKDKTLISTFVQQAILHNISPQTTPGVLEIFFNTLFSCTDKEFEIVQKILFDEQHIARFSEKDHPNKFSHKILTYAMITFKKLPASHQLTFLKNYNSFFNNAINSLSPLTLENGDSLLDILVKSYPPKIVSKLLDTLYPEGKSDTFVEKSFQLALDNKKYQITPIFLERFPHLVPQLPAREPLPEQVPAPPEKNNAQEKKSKKVSHPDKPKNAPTQQSLPAKEAPQKNNPKEDTPLQPQKSSKKNKHHDKKGPSKTLPLVATSSQKLTPLANEDKDDTPFILVRGKKSKNTSLPSKEKNIPTTPKPQKNKPTYARVAKTPKVTHAPSALESMTKSYAENFPQLSKSEDASISVAPKAMLFTPPVKLNPKSIAIYLPALISQWILPNKPEKNTPEVIKKLLMCVLDTDNNDLFQTLLGNVENMKTYQSNDALKKSFQESGFLETLASYLKDLEPHAFRSKSAFIQLHYPLLYQAFSERYVIQPETKTRPRTLSL